MSALASPTAVGSRAASTSRGTRLLAAHNLQTAALATGNAAFAYRQEVTEIRRGGASQAFVSPMAASWMRRL